MRKIRHFFTKPPAATKALRVNGIGVHEWMEPCLVDRPQGTGDWLFMFFYDAMVLGVEGERRETAPRQMMIWDPAQGHYYGNMRGRWNHAWMHAAGSALPAWLKAAPLPVNRPFLVSDPSVIERGLVAVYEELTEPAGADPVVVANLFENWLRQISRAVRSADAPADIPEPFMRLKHELDVGFAERVTLARLADRVHLSVPHFCAEFKRHFGVPAMEYVIRQRLHHAAYLLRDRNRRVKEVAQAVGYDDLYHFSKLFKKHYGLSPRRLRG